MLALGVANPEKDRALLRSPNHRSTTRYFSSSEVAEQASVVTPPSKIMVPA